LKAVIAELGGILWTEWISGFSRHGGRGVPAAGFAQSKAINELPCRLPPVENRAAT
jgi:hypothetical protein